MGAVLQPREEEGRRGRLLRQLQSVGHAGKTAQAAGVLSRHANADPLSRRQELHDRPRVPTETRVLEGDTDKAGWDSIYALQNEASAVPSSDWFPVSHQAQGSSELKPGYATTFTPCPSPSLNRKSDDRY